MVDVKVCFQFNITLNAPISLRWDHWCNRATISEILGTNHTVEIPDCFLKYVISSSQWVFPVNFPLHLRNICENFTVAADAGPCLAWKNCDNYKFSNFIEELYASTPNCSWYKHVWPKKNIIRHSIFV
ncbi:hypothetical protein KFK09_013337 [Dendrobium nobile]|uniref:Uncharacterized protein n=1 Tax=Dendrobium nobile TaxID=94219 RepID=A0A8T3B8J4_DENNO|nr:hypothetical protein KFK09_013337 [Dendrobium nobile]